MKTFDDFLTEARVTTKRGRILRTLSRQVKKVGKIALNSKPAKKAKRYVKATATGVALKLLTGL
jgi:hypothetical protein